MDAEYIGLAHYRRHFGGKNYQSTLPKKALEDYDQEVAAYYLNRQTNARKETL